VANVTTQTAQKPENRLVRYLRETRAELRKVTWPTRQQATNLTLIVLAVTLVMALFLGACDLIFATLVRQILS
jgi:preprotein translocase subunit SecE